MQVMLYTVALPCSKVGPAKASEKRHKENRVQVIEFRGNFEWSFEAAKPVSQMLSGKLVQPIKMIKGCRSSLMRL